MVSFEDILKNLPGTNPAASLSYALALAYVPHVVKVFAMKDKMKKEGKTYEIANNRQLTNQIIDNSPEGKYISHCVGAHINGLEAFSYYSAAILAGIATGVDKVVLAGAATAFLGARTAYTIIYLTPLNGILRSVAFFASFSIPTYLFYVAGKSYDNK